MLVDWVIFPQIVTSIASSQNGEYIATMHLGVNGAFLWVNKTVFQRIVVNHVPQTPIYLAFGLVDQPIPHLHKSSKGRAHFYSVEDAFLDSTNNKEKNASLLEQQINRELLNIDLSNIDKNRGIELSGEAESKWRSIYQIEQIKERNQPILPPQPPPNIPFFLYDVNNLVKTDTPNTLQLKSKQSLLLENIFHQKQKNTPEQTTAILRNNKYTSELTKKNKKIKLLRASGIQKNKEEIEVEYRNITKYLRSLGPSKIQTEFIEIGKKVDYLMIMIDYFVHEVNRGKEFELIQAYLNLFLKVIKYMSIYI